MIRRISSGGPYEAKVGYCRAVVAGETVYVSGTCAQGNPIPSDVLGQCQSALSIIEAALTEAGTDMAHVVRASYYMADMADFEACWPALRAAFGQNPPAAKVIQVPMVAPEYLIEIEVTAVLP